MAKKINKDSLISVELEKLQKKVDEFQKYLEMNPIITQVTKDNIIVITEDDQDKLHKELLVQIKVQDAIFSWLPLLEKLKEEKSTKDMATYGNVEVNGMFKNKK